MIPRVTHQFWAGEGMPEEETEWRNNLIRLNPNFEHLLWDEPAQRVLDIPEKLWQSAKNYSEKSDIVRWYAVRRHCGIYADTDMDWYRPLDELLGCDCFVGLYRDRATRNVAAPLPTVFGAKRAHIFTEKCIEQLWRRMDMDADSGTKYGTVCDEVWSSLDYPHIDAPVVMLPGCYFYPYPASERKVCVETGKMTDPRDCRETGAFGAHHWTGSWA